MNAPVSLQLDTAVSGRTRIVRVAGELDMATGPQLQAEITRLLEIGDDKRIVLDLAELRFLDCAAIRHLSQLAKLAAEHHTSLRVCNASGIVDDVLRLTGLDNILHLPPLGTALLPRNRRVCTDESSKRAEAESS